MGRRRLEMCLGVRGGGRRVVSCQGRFFTDEVQLFRVQGNTYALSKMWGITCLPLLNEIVAQLPAGSMSYAKTETLN